LKERLQLKARVAVLLVAALTKYITAAHPVKN